MAVRNQFIHEDDLDHGAINRAFSKSQGDVIDINNKIAASNITTVANITIVALTAILILTQTVAILPTIIGALSIILILNIAAHNLLQNAGGQERHFLARNRNLFNITGGNLCSLIFRSGYQIAMPEAEDLEDRAHAFDRRVARDL